MIVGCITLITVNTLIFGFVTWLPTFFVHSGRSIAQSLQLLTDHIYRRAHPP